ncbi:hypothetical protein [Vibrio paucivorans]
MLKKSLSVLSISLMTSLSINASETIEAPKEPTYIDITPRVPGMQPYKISIPATEQEIYEAIAGGAELDLEKFTFITDEDTGIAYAHSDILEATKYCNYWAGVLLTQYRGNIAYASLSEAGDNVNNHGWPFQSIPPGPITGEFGKKLSLYQEELYVGDLSTGLTGYPAVEGLLVCHME